MATLTENMLTVNMLLSVFFLPGALADDCYGKTPALSITTPNTVEALTGSCLQIPCTYDTEHPQYNSSRRIYAVWMKGKIDLRPDVIFNSSGSVNKYQLEIIGNLTEKNCTTLFPNLTPSHTDRYFFRVENYPFVATACADPLHIRVKDSPWSPSINVPSDLKEHQSVTVTCSAFTPCPNSPPQLTWTLQQDSLRHTEKNTDGTFTTKIQETITLSDTHDGYNISCSARYPVIGGNKTAKTEVTLSVSYAPRNTSVSISPSGLVSAGSWVELSCSSRAKPPPTFTWFRKSKDGDMNVSVGPIYSFNVTEGGEYYCVSANDLGQQKSLKFQISIEGSFPFLIVLLTVVVAIVLIWLLILVWWFKFKHPSSQHAQSENDENIYVEMSTNKQDQELHYEEVHFQRMRAEASAVSQQDSGQQEIVYAQVKVSDAANGSARTANNPESLYAKI